MAKKEFENIFCLLGPIEDKKIVTRHLISLCDNLAASLKDLNKKFPEVALTDTSVRESFFAYLESVFF